MASTVATRVGVDDPGDRRGPRCFDQCGERTVSGQLVAHAVVDQVSIGQHDRRCGHRPEQGDRNHRERLVSGEPWDRDTGGVEGQSITIDWIGTDVDPDDIDAGRAEIDLVDRNRELERSRLTRFQFRIHFLEELGVPTPEAQVVIHADLPDLGPVLQRYCAVAQDGIDVLQRLVPGVLDGSGKSERVAGLRDCRFDRRDGRRSGRDGDFCIHRWRGDGSRRRRQPDHDEHGPKGHDGSASCRSRGSRSSSRRSEA